MSEFNRVPQYVYELPEPWRLDGRYTRLTLTLVGAAAMFRLEQQRLVETIDSLPPVSELMWMRVQNAYDAFMETDLPSVELQTLFAALRDGELRGRFEKDAVHSLYWQLLVMDVLGHGFLKKHLPAARAFYDDPSVGAAAVEPSSERLVESAMKMVDSVMDDKGQADPRKVEERLQEIRTRVDRRKLDLHERYQQCAQRIWRLFESDPLPNYLEAQTFIERLEALLDHGLLRPKLELDLVRALRQARAAAIAEEREACAREADAEANRILGATLEQHREQARAQVQCAAWIAKHIRERGGA